MVDYYDSKFSLNEVVTSTGIVYRHYRGADYNYFPSKEDSKIRLVIENAGPTNQVVVRARIKGASGYDVIAIINGSSNRVLRVNTYDEIQLEVTLYETTSTGVKLIASGFNMADGDIEVSTPVGISSPGTDTLSFTSSDGTVEITGDGEGGLDFSVPAVVGINFKPETLYTLTSGDITAKQITLDSTPAHANLTQMFIIGGNICEYGSDFIVVGSILIWNSLGLDGLLEAGEKIVIMHD